MGASRLAWPLWGLSIVLAVSSAALWIRNGVFEPRTFTAFLFLVPGYATVGALVAVRRRNRIGWLFLGIGVAAAALSLGFQYSLRAYVVAPGSLPASPWGVWLQDTLVSLSVIGLASWCCCFLMDGSIPALAPVRLGHGDLVAAILLWGCSDPTVCPSQAI